MLRFLDQDLTRYVDLLQAFLAKPEVRKVLGPKLYCDHLAVKLADSDDFEAFLKEVQPLATRITVTPLDGRRIATATLASKVCGYASDFQPFVGADMLEIMEPRPGKIGLDLVGIDHIEVVIPTGSFAQIKAALEEVGIPCNRGNGEDTYQHTVVVRLNDTGQELKLSDEPLRDLLPGQIERGETKIIFP